MASERNISSDHDSGEDEKGITQIESGKESSPVKAVDPSIEKRVVKKLDYNVVPLVMALCEQYTAPFFVSKPF